MVKTSDIHAVIDALRASGAAEHSPIRFAYLDALARRAAVQPEHIRARLMARISAAAIELATSPAAPPTEITKNSAASPLADLLAYISQQGHTHPGTTQPTTDNPTVNRNFQPKSKSASASGNRQTPELKSVAYFRTTWSKLSAEQHLTQTLAQAPENAGPMNSQHLVLRSLLVMRDIAPDYLQGFMSYIDTLFWLEHADPTKLPAGRSSSSASYKKMRSSKRSATNRK